MSSYQRAADVFENASGHKLYSVSAKNEAERFYQHALSDLTAAVPSYDAFEAGTSIKMMITTPDFHAGKPMPVGVVTDVENALLPHMIGNDIGCGMRLIVLQNVKVQDFTSALDDHLRHIFFQGGRDIALRGCDREAILRDGIPGLVDSLSSGRRGILSRFDFEQIKYDVQYHADQGFFETTSIDPDFEEFARDREDYRHDAILGTIGGGNHFVEFGVVDQIVDGGFAYHCGLKKDTVVLIVHSGSLDFGQRVGSTISEYLRLHHAKGQGRILDTIRDPMMSARYVNAMANAANVAVANRFFIALAAIEALQRTMGREINYQLIYDAPHNMIWNERDIWRHRKGACPARGAALMQNTPYEFMGEPVILPGSMGDASWLLKGLGNDKTLQSSAHGAGRRLSRGEARRKVVFPAVLRVVGPLDLKDRRICQRADIMKEIEGRFREEAPAAYRPVETVVCAMEHHEMTSRVARFQPLLTVKG